MFRRCISLLTQRNNGDFVSDRNPSDSISGVERNGGGNSVPDSIGGEEKRENNSPPDDDVCPICFGNYNVPCKTDCGHWFCGSCIMRFWNYKASVKRCKCPICSCFISVLTPEECLLSRQDKEVIEVLENVRRYNCLFQGGLRGLLQNVLALPFLIKIIFQGLMDPDRFRVNYYAGRLVGLMLGLLYQMSPFDFLPTGGYAAPRLFELSAILLVVVLCLIGLCYRAVHRRRLRHLVATHDWTDM